MFNCYAQSQTSTLDFRRNTVCGIIIRRMKNKLFFMAIAICATLGVCAHEAVPAYPNFGLPRVEEMMFLVLQIGIIIFAAKLGGMLASLMKMPSILGELAAGIVIGPWALGGIGFCLDWFNGIFKDGLFHGAALREMAAHGQNFDATSPALYGIATLASIILLFLSGLETNLKMFLKYSFVGSMVGVGGVVVSFVFGDLCAVWLLPKFFPHFKHLAEIPFAEAVTSAAPLYMGIMSTATSVGITARILSEKKKMDSEEGTTIMAGAVIDDVLGLIVLAIGNGIIAAAASNHTGSSVDGEVVKKGMDWGNIGLVAIKAFGVWLGATAIGVLGAPYIAKFLKKCFKSPVVIATMAFGLALVLAGFFEMMGLAMIIGAYVMGLSLSRTDLKHPITEMLTPVYTFLVPIFFCAMGMMVDMSALCSKSVLIFGGIYTVLAIAAKVLGCMIPSMCCGFNVLGGLRIGAGMVPRGEVALIIAGIGLSAGYLTQDIFGIGILMTLITTVVAPPTLVALFTPKARGVRNPKPSVTNSRQIEFELPDSQVAGIMMRKLVDEFMHEGFFATQFTNEPHMSIWSVSMEEMELTLQKVDNVIKVECTPAEEQVFNQAWMEVVSQMNNLSKVMSKPLQNRKNMADLVANVDSPTKDKGDSSLAVRYVQNFAMIPSFKAYSKKEAIEKLVQTIADTYPRNVTNLKEVTQAVFTREESMPTGLDHGIAVPHGRSDGVNNIIGAVAIVDNSENENGIIPDYETIDHSKIQVIVLTLVPESSHLPYLQVMAYISRILHAENGIDKLIECQTAEEMRNFFKDGK